MSTVAVVGGTGQVGVPLVDTLLGSDHQVRVLSRRPRAAGADRSAQWAVVDYRTRAGLVDALDGVDTVVLLSGALQDAPIVRAVGETASATTHLVYLSIVGIERVPMRYYRAKLAGEQAVTGSGRPWTIQRATQFHSLVASVLGVAARSPVFALPAGVVLQPIDVGDVVSRLAALAGRPPVGRAEDMGGPQVLRLDELAAQYLAATGRRRRIRPLRLPGRLLRAVADGGLTCPDHPVTGGRTFTDYLADRFGQRRGER